MNETLHWWSRKERLSQPHLNYSLQRSNHTRTWVHSSISVYLITAIIYYLIGRSKPPLFNISIPTQYSSPSVPFMYGLLQCSYSIRLIHNVLVSVLPHPYRFMAISNFFVGHTHHLYGCVLVPEVPPVTQNIGCFFAANTAICSCGSSINETCSRKDTNSR